MLWTLLSAMALAGPAEAVAAGVEAYRGNDYEGAAARMDVALANAGSLRPVELSTAHLVRAQARLAMSSDDEGHRAPLLLGAAEDAKAAEEGDPSAVGDALMKLQDELAAALYDAAKPLVRRGKHAQAIPMLTAAVGLVPILDAQVMLCSAAGRAEAHEIAIPACNACMDQALEAVIAPDFNLAQCAAPAVNAYLYGRSPKEPDNAVRAVEKGRRVYALQKKRTAESASLLTETQKLNGEVSERMAREQLGKLERVSKAYHPTQWTAVADDLVKNATRRDYGLVLVVAGRAADAKNTEAAIALFEKAMALNPTRYEAAFNLGVMYVNTASDQRGNAAVEAQMRRGLELLQQAYEKNPSSGALGPILQVCERLRDQACLDDYN